MNVNADGHLCLYVCDLTPEKRHLVAPVMEDFGQDAWVAAAYANRAGYKVLFVRPGMKAIMVTGNQYFEERKVE